MKKILQEIKLIKKAFSKLKKTNLNLKIIINELIY